MKRKKKQQKLFAININLFVKNYDELYFCLQVSPSCPFFFWGGGGGGGGINPHMKIMGKFVVSLRENSARVVSAWVFRKESSL